MTKLEEIALAIHRARYPDAAVMDSMWGLSHTVAAQALVEARAAMEVAREPACGMVDAGHNGIHPSDASVHVIPIYQAMIDAILNEKPGA